MKIHQKNICRVASKNIHKNVSTILSGAAALLLLQLSLVGCKARPSAPAGGAHPNGVAAGNSSAAVVRVGVLDKRPGAAISVHGHRGARAVYPESTLASFKEALEGGADALELDLHVSADQQLIIHHDPFLGGPSELCRYRTSKGKLLVFTQVRFIHQLNMDYLSRVDCGSQKSKEFSQQKLLDKESFEWRQILTLEQLLSWLDNEASHGNSDAARIQLNIEMKSAAKKFGSKATPSAEKFARLLVESLTRHRALGRSLVQSFDLSMLNAVQQIERNLPLSYLIEERVSRSEAHLQEWKSMGLKVISPKYDIIKSDDIQYMHNQGLQVLVWTPNSKSAWDKLVDSGVDGIITDNPRELREYLNTKK